MLALLVSGCGLGAGSPPGGVSLVVTNEFGSTLLHQRGRLEVAGQETAMSLLMRNYPVSTRYDGGFVESIDGLSGGSEHGHRVDWFFFVNGVESTKGAAEVVVHSGETIWWDRHDWSQTEHVPAVVGSFPEPFLGGYDGKRYPVRIECAQPTSHACATVGERLRAVGVPAAIAGIGGGGGESIRVLVGPWRDVRADYGVEGIEKGPARSGVYALMSSDGRRLSLLDATGRVVRTLTSGAGLIAATRVGEDGPAWVVTGTDEAGIERAADAMERLQLEHHFAVAVAAAGSIPLPVSER